LASKLGDRENKRDTAVGVLAMMVGGMTLARAVAHEALADQILADCREQADHLVSVCEKSPRRGRQPRRTKGENQ
jgi:hypothetical protein